MTLFCFWRPLLSTLVHPWDAHLFPPKPAVMHCFASSTWRKSDPKPVCSYKEDTLKHLLIIMAITLKFVCLFHLYDRKSQTDGEKISICWCIPPKASCGSPVWMVGNWLLHMSRAASKSVCKQGATSGAGPLELRAPDVGVWSEAGKLELRAPDVGVWSAAGPLEVRAPDSVYRHAKWQLKCWVKHLSLYFCWPIKTLQFVIF